MKVNVSVEQKVAVQDAVSTDTVVLEHDSDTSTPLPRPERRRRKSKADRGLPDDAELARLAETYLEHQYRLHRNAASCGALPLANAETIQAMVDDFKRRHRGGGVDREQVKAQLRLLRINYHTDAGLPTAHDAFEHVSSSRDGRKLTKYVNDLHARSFRIHFQRFLWSAHDCDLQADIAIDAKHGEAFLDAIADFLAAPIT